MTKEHFLGKSIMELVDNGVTFRVEKRRNNSKYAYNYFDIHEKTKKPSMQLANFNQDSTEMFEMFIHEYCHFLQWKENSPLWKLGWDSNQICDKWLYKKIPDFDINDLKNIQKLELDCDKRVIRTIKQNKLPVDIDKYIVESNSYIWSYSVMYKIRKFFNLSVLYYPELLLLVPAHHLSFDEIDASPEYIDTFLKLSKYK